MNNSTPVTSVGDVAALEGIISRSVRRIQSARTSATRNVKRSRRSEERPDVAAEYELSSFKYGALQEIFVNAIAVLAGRNVSIFVLFVASFGGLRSIGVL